MSNDNITVYDLRKIMLTAFQDSNISSAFFEMLYDYFNCTSGIKSTSLKDYPTTKYIDITTKKKVDSLKTISAIKSLYAKFAINIINTKELEYVLSKIPEYSKAKINSEADVFYAANGAASISDISTDTDSIFRIYLI